MIDPEGLLMIEPTGPASSSPVLDDLTRGMCAVWRHLRRDAEEGYRGWHTCVCGAQSDNRDHWIGGWLTNSLCIHYLAYHRDEVPAEELAKVRALAVGGAEPDNGELSSPRRKLLYGVND